METVAKEKEIAIGIVIALQDWFVILTGSGEKTFVRQVKVRFN